jgi:predicted MPP superfamily phosphohydrolase
MLYSSRGYEQDEQRFMKRPRMNRRRFLLGAVLAAPCLAVADAKLLEPGWVKVRRVRLGNQKPTHRIVQFSDVHHKGDRPYLESVVRTINSLSPDFVCFTGDVIEETKHLAEAIEIFSGIKSPTYGIPGNHDYWSKAPFDGLKKCFAASGGGWLLDEQLPTHDGKFVIHGATCLGAKQPPITTTPSAGNIFLMHYPAWVGRLGSTKFDLILAGHSHGGQVRLPFIGALFVPYGVEHYQMGMFSTPSGPLYVNPGIGWFPWPIRFNCRPEITVFEI